MTKFVGTALMILVERLLSLRNPASGAEEFCVHRASFHLTLDDPRFQICPI